MRRGLRKQMQMGLEWAIRRSDELEPVLRHSPGQLHGGVSGRLGGLTVPRADTELDELSANGESGSVRSEPGPDHLRISDGPSSLRHDVAQIGRRRMR